ncbi:TIGR03905 family TSCPD domain-containing protein [Salidesulfovibrio onnuriiensis]|uniref:TIGR03905 family TSCPD domain-containing protein n=1 Tax=Salidesulfovibrio onnuriiensis TaxID=2583823 RepID=UPI0011C936F9|nr:TIGR03905 family TSCPD domain-containing protein [Salidesulfovibrio onnuriiensis]
MDLNELLEPLARIARPKTDDEVYVPKGVCSKLIRFRVEEGRLHDVEFTGGCHGNLQGIGKLVEGMSLAEVAQKLGGIACGKRSSSCPDQLVQAITPYLED